DGVADILWNGRNFLWVLRGKGDGTFVYMNAAWGIDDKSAATVDDGLCFGDIDGDGRLDIIGYTGDLDGQRRIKVYRNDLAPGHWLRVRPVGAAGNRGAAGAKIRITEAGGTDRKLLWYEQVMILASQSAHSYYSLARTERHFGLGPRTAVDVSVEFYPSGKKVERKNVPADCAVEIAEEASAP
ncbi:MAG: VCBS repeat-containing protein, partial [Planctomycetota bacterium]|nr:VCBS repeat-containing protein [Planctomycetota bacterium]